MDKLKRVNRPYLNLLVKVFLEKNIILCILKGEMPFKMHKFIFYSGKKMIKKNMSTQPKIFRLVTRYTIFLTIKFVEAIFMVFDSICSGYWNFTII